jgi:hypothetical protein
MEPVTPAAVRTGRGRGRGASGLLSTWETKSAAGRGRGAYRTSTAEQQQTTTPAVGRSRVNWSGDRAPLQPSVTASQPAATHTWNQIATTIFVQQV